jgi:hypothetical protein
MVLNDWQRGKLPFFVPPPGCALEPKPEGGGELTTEDQPDEEEPEADDDNDDDDNDEDEEVEEGSDAETTCTTDTTQTTDTTKTTDSLFENVKFKDYDEGGDAPLPGGGSERSTPVRRPPPINLQAGLEKTRVYYIKKPAQWFFWVFGFFCFFCFFWFFGFLVFWFFWFFWFFLYICPEERVFRVFPVSRILLGASRLYIIITHTN